MRKGKGEGKNGGYTEKFLNFGLVIGNSFSPNSLPAPCTSVRVG